MSINSQGGSSARSSEYNLPGLPSKEDLKGREDAPDTFSTKCLKVLEASNGAVPLKISSAFTNITKALEGLNLSGGSPIASTELYIQNLHTITITIFWP